MNCIIELIGVFPHFLVSIIVFYFFCKRGIILLFTIQVRKNTKKYELLIKVQKINIIFIWKNSNSNVFSIENLFNCQNNRMRLWRFYMYYKLSSKILQIKIYNNKVSVDVSVWFLQGKSVICFDLFLFCAAHLEGYVIFPHILPHQKLIRICYISKLTNYVHTLGSIG